MEVIAPLIFYSGLCFAIAYFLGRKRQIGLGWSLFFSLFFSPIIGFLATMLSPKYYDPDPEPSGVKRVIGWIIAGFFGVGVIVAPVSAGMINGPAAALQQLFLAIGMVGVGAYLIGRGKGNSYSSTALVPDRDEQKQE
jgi:MFS family permease